MHIMQISIHTKAVIVPRTIAENKVKFVYMCIYTRHLNSFYKHSTRHSNRLNLDRRFSFEKDLTIIIWL